MFTPYWKLTRFNNYIHKIMAGKKRKTKILRELVTQRVLEILIS